MKVGTILQTLQKQKQLKENSEQLHINKLDRLGEMNKFLKTHKPQKLSQKYKK